jgi:hypothetical protein
MGGIEGASKEIRQAQQKRESDKLKSQMTPEREALFAQLNRTADVTIPTQGRDVTLPDIPAPNRDVTLSDVSSITQPAPAAPINVQTAKPTAVADDIPVAVGAGAGAGVAAATGASSRTRANAAARSRAAASTKAEKPPRKRDREEPETPMPDSGPSPEKDVKPPPKFGMDVSLNRPQGFDTGVIRDVRLRNAYLNSMQGSPQGPAMGRGLKESSSEQRELLRRLTRDRAKTYTYQFSTKANTSAPQSSSSSTPLTYQRRVQQRELQYYTQPQSVTESIDYMLSNNIDEMNINIKGTDIKINSAIANKINNLYESLNDENKTKMVNMLEESVDSFKQILNFAVRQ